VNLVKKFLSFTLFSLFLFQNGYAADSSECQMALEKYYEMDLASLESIKKEKKSRIQKRAYNQVVKEMKWLEKNRPSAWFRVDEDDFTGDKSYKTNGINPVDYTRSICYAKNKIRKGSLSLGGHSVFLRKSCQGDACMPPQIYIGNYRMNEYMFPDPISYYYAINRAVIKGVGDVDYTGIDIQYVAQTHRNLFNKTIYMGHYIDFGVSLNNEQLKELDSKNEDVLLRLYSTAAKYDLDFTIPYSQISVFVKGMDEENGWSK
jgi:hypothetical protein